LKQATREVKTATRSSIRMPQSLIRSNLSKNQPKQASIDQTSDI
jgi:hypothetical protein